MSVPFVFVRVRVRMSNAESRIYVWGSVVNKTPDDFAAAVAGSQTNKFRVATAVLCGDKWPVQNRR